MIVQYGDDTLTSAAPSNDRRSNFVADAASVRDQITLRNDADAGCVGHDARKYSNRSPPADASGGLLTAESFSP
jgi:hypothetical protein